MLDNAADWGINYPSLQSIFDDLEYYTAVKFAYDNPEAAKDVFRKAGWDDERIEMEVSSNNQLYSRFAEISRWEGVENDEFKKVITSSVVDVYINELISKYSLTSYKADEALKSQLIATYKGLDGKDYSSYDPYRLTFSFQIAGSLNDIIARKYAAVNYQDAVSFYKANHKITDDEQIKNVRPDEILQQYSWFVIGNGKDDTPEGFTPTSTIDFNSYKIGFMVDVYKATPDTAKRVLSVDAYVTSTHKYIKDIEILGVVPDYKLDQYSMRSYMVASDALINMLFGPNRGGVYAYAVGVMPTDRAGINEVVKFSKTYMNESGDAKYQLSNNVTSQLDMVDEILEVLGQVFLYVGIGFAMFASLMLTNFIGTSITHKKQEIGILRAIGSRSADVFRIFFAESFIIAMINYVLALAGTFSVTMVINNILRQDAGLLITFLSFGVRQIGILLLVSLGVAFIATFFPVKKIASMKPIDAIKNRK